MNILGKWASSARDSAFSQAEEFWVQTIVPTWWKEKTNCSTFSSCACAAANSHVHTETITKIHIYLKKRMQSQSTCTQWLSFEGIDYSPEIHILKSTQIVLKQVDLDRDIVWTFRLFFTLFIFIYHTVFQSIL